MLGIFIFESYFKQYQNRLGNGIGSMDIQAWKQPEHTGNNDPQI